MSALLPYSVVGPDGIVRTGNCDMLLIPTAGGGVGIMAGHEAMLAGLSAGELRIRSGDRVERLFIEGGICRVEKGEARLLVGRVLEASELDPKELAAREAALAEVASRITAPGLRAELRRRERVARGLLDAVQAPAPAGLPR